MLAGVGVGRETEKKAGNRLSRPLGARIVQRDCENENSFCMHVYTGLLQTTGHSHFSLFGARTENTINNLITRKPAHSSHSFC